ncbi:hypothetical protein JCM30471_13150 [Desulfuromonas carbonis]|uniref:hypothetical protein n=1 Tax=Desulfuromonas sp. DDH964 TaxID=1823759 RepID=UPI00078ED548|nr:hypothetical protein [Desulfuromonas sp. DDH964]AMV72799.1 hypothetical protein DBW_2469 [Desulfuromonas sp. DDH964]
MPRFAPSCALFLLLTFLPACSGPASAGTARPQPAASANHVEFSGQVVLKQLEGGFCGLVAADGQRYDPVNLPVEFCQDGLAVQVSGERIEGGVSFRMWGKQLRIDHIERR